MRYLSLAISAVLSLIIFSFSFASGEASGSLSLEISNFILNIITDLFPNNSIDISELHVVVRKSAHIFEYCILGLSWFFTAKLWNVSYVNLLWIGLMISASDEAIQIYSEDRGPSVLDVIVFDFIPFMIITLILLLINNRRGNEKMTSTLMKLQDNSITPEKAYKELYNPRRKKLLITKKAHFIKVRIKTPDDKGANRLLAVLLFFPIPIFIIRFFFMFVKKESLGDEIPLTKSEIIDMISQTNIRVQVNTNSGEKILVKTI